MCDSSNTLKIVERNGVLGSSSFDPRSILGKAMRKMRPSEARDSGRKKSDAINVLIPRTTHNLSETRPQFN